MEWNGCIKMMQGYLENGPVIVLGSGASVPYGLPSMGELANEIKQDSIVNYPPPKGSGLLLNGSPDLV